MRQFVGLVDPSARRGWLATTAGVGRVGLGWRPRMTGSGPCFRTGARPHTGSQSSRRSRTTADWLKPYPRRPVSCTLRCRGIILPPALVLPMPPRGGVGCSSSGGESGIGLGRLTGPSSTTRLGSGPHPRGRLSSGIWPLSLGGSRAHPRGRLSSGICLGPPDGLCMGVMNYTTITISVTTAAGLELASSAGAQLVRDVDRLLELHLLKNP